MSSSTDKQEPVHAINMSQECVDELKECVHEFFTKYLNRVEESDSGKLFNTVTIGCCRVLMLGPLNEVLERMRVLSGAGRNPLSVDGIDGAKVGEVGVWGDKWVGLTDEEIYDYADKFLYTHGSNFGIKSFGKAIEAKLKEKNT